MHDTTISNICICIDELTNQLSLTILLQFRVFDKINIKFLLIERVVQFSLNTHSYFRLNFLETKFKSEELTVNKLFNMI